MFGGDLVREARRRAGLSQGELASRAGTTQSAIARVERGRSAPSFDRVDELVSACGLRLRVSIVETVDELESGTDVVQPDVLRPLLERGARFVASGRLAARLHGGRVRDLVPEICPEPTKANLEALCDALADLGARRRTPDGSGTLPLDRTPEDLLARGAWLLDTTEGELNVLLQPPGTQGFRDLARDAVVEEAGGLELLTISLADAVRELQAAGEDPELLHSLRAMIH